jgi:hypothetical protein
MEGFFYVGVYKVINPARVFQKTLQRYLSGGGPTPLEVKTDYALLAFLIILFVAFFQFL